MTAFPSQVLMSYSTAHYVFYSHISIHCTAYKKYKSSPPSTHTTTIHVTYCIDYCNSLLFCLTHKFPICFNATHTITKNPSFHHITPVLKHFHWLQSKLQMNFKILLHTFKVIHNITPPDLSDLLDTITSSKWGFLKHRSLYRKSLQYLKHFNKSDIWWPKVT